jgi:hypothetical protein
VSIKKKEKAKEETPAAYRSRLSPHLEQIRSWRRARKTWREIRDLLAIDPEPVDVTLQAVQSFFKSATDPKRRIPLGFEDPHPAPAPPAAAAAPAPEPGPAAPITRPVDLSAKKTPQRISPFGLSDKK